MKRNQRLTLDFLCYSQQLLMQQQHRSSGLFGSISPLNQGASSSSATTGGAGVGQNGMRRWGMDQTKL